MGNALVRRILIGAAACTITACGGGGGGSGFVNSTPTPTPTPTPTASSAPFGIQSDAQFPTVGEDIDIRWNNSAQTYELRFSTGDWEKLTRVGDEFYPASSSYGLSISSGLPYQYTKLATVFENSWGGTLAQFAFGLPTAAGDVPTTGSASYDARVWGTGNVPNQPAGSYYDVSGTAKLNFDFGGGTLSGSMQTSVAGPNGLFTPPSYTFDQTVYSSGSTSFSGSFVVPNTSGSSSFSGQFTGPNAAELMAQWTAPFLDPTSMGTPQGIMSGVWIGKKN